jgi:hypothetical protein
MHRVDVDRNGWPGHAPGLTEVPYAIPGRAGESCNDDVLFVAPVLFADSFGVTSAMPDKAARLSACLWSSLPLIAAGIAASSVLADRDDDSRYSLPSTSRANDALGTAASDAAAVAAILGSLQFVLTYLQRSRVGE